MENVYFDNSATTRIDEEVLREMMPFFKENYGNASSIYKLGRTSKKAIEESREKIAKAINANPEDIYFTAGGSESDNTIIKGIAHFNKNKGNHIVTSRIEHPAVLETCKQLEQEGFEVTYINVNNNGIIDLEELKKSITENTILISIMFANNEIGTIQPIKEIGEIARKHKIVFHTDAVQAIGSVPIDVKKLNIDSLSMSAHKFYGPKGIGALYVKNGIKFRKLIAGGHQEKDKRAGTENVAGIVGMGKAIEIATNNIAGHNEKIQKLRDYYISEIKEKIPNIKINGDLEKRLPGNANISFESIKGDSLLFNLDLKEICASSGSACSSGSIDPSHVLKAIKTPENFLNNSLRISIGKYNTKEEVDYLIKNLIEVVNRLREI